MKRGVVVNVGLFLVAMVIGVKFAVHGTVADMRGMVMQHPDLMHLYTFEDVLLDAGGANLLASTYALDSVGSNNLFRWAYNPVGARSFHAGVDGFSHAVTTVQGTSPGTGASWRTTNSIALPTTMSVECVLRPNVANDKGYSRYLVAMRELAYNGRRGYLLRITNTGKFNIWLGTSGTSHDFSDTLVDDHWYYGVVHKQGLHFMCSNGIVPLWVEVCFQYSESL